MYRVKILPDQRNSICLLLFLYCFRWKQQRSGGQCSAPKFYIISIKIISDFTKIAAFNFYFFLHYLNPEVSGYLSCLWLTTQRYTVDFYYFAEVIFYKITTNFELATTKPLFLVENIVLGFCKLLLTIFSLTYPYLPVFVFKKPV